MKKKIVPILSGILALTMLSGCGAPQAQTEPTTVNQAMLIEKSSQPQETYSFPDRFTGDWTTQEGKLTIHADAPVVAEQGVALPTATVEPRECTQADVDNLLRVFLKGEALYSHVQTKDELQASLDHINSRPNTTTASAFLSISNALRLKSWSKGLSVITGKRAIFVPPLP